MPVYIRFITLASATLYLSACAWVKPLPNSHVVALLNANDIVNCVKKGTTNSKTLSKFLFIPRVEDKVNTELVTLAKNEAIIMGGDAVVAESDLEAGAQTFGIYLCRNGS